MGILEFDKKLFNKPTQPQLSKWLQRALVSHETT